MHSRPSLRNVSKEQGFPDDIRPGLAGKFSPSIHYFKLTLGEAKRNHL